MSERVYFSMSTGLSATVRVPRGTLAKITEHVERVERLLHLERVYSERAERLAFIGEPPEPRDPSQPPSPAWWCRTDFSGVPDDVLCDTADSHNAWVRRFYDDLAVWSLWDPAAVRADALLVGDYDGPVAEPAAEPDTEDLTPELASTFWHGLELIEVPPRRWTSDYYLRTMRHLYEVLRGRPSDGVELDAKALSAKQAGAVISLFEKYLQPARSGHDLEVILGQDQLASRELGEYVWCPTHGAVDPDSPCSHIRAEQRAEEQ